MTSHPPANKGRASVRVSILFGIAWRNLTAKKLRSLLTIFGVVIGIGAIFFLLSFGLGLRQLVTTEVLGDQSIKSIDITSQNSKLLSLDDKAVNTIKQFAYVENVGTQFSYPGSIQHSGAEIDSVVYGIDSSYQKMISLNLVAGRLLKNEDYRQIVINNSALSSLGISDAKKTVGTKLKLTIPLQDGKSGKISDDFTIVGVIESGSGAEIFMPKDNFSIAGVHVYKNAKAIVANTDNVPVVRKQIENLGFQTTSPVDMLDQINQIFKFFTLMLVGFGSVGMIVSVLGMFNTMTISLLERTREIGLMMALGARNRDMRRLFVFEAVLISFIGALVGIALATIGGKIITLIMNHFAASRGVTERFELFSTPLWAIVTLTVFTVIVGLIVVYIPARRAQKINPIDALRRE